MRITAQTYCLFLLMMLVSAGIRAQQLPAVSQNQLNPYFLNPAFAGYSGYSEVFGLYKKQWSSVPGAPEDQMITAATLIPKYNLGVGLKLYNEVNNFLGNTGLAVSFAYHLPVAEKHTLSFGLNPGVTFHRIYFDRLKADDPFENTILNRTENSSAFDVDFGFRYTYEGLNLGFAASNLLQSSMVFQTEELSQQVSLSHVRHFNITAYYDFQLSASRWAFTPGLAVYSVQGMKSSVEATIKTTYNEFIWLGINYRHEAAAGGFLGIKLDDKFLFSYNYEYPTNNFNQISNNSHELVFGFRFGNKKYEEQQQKLLSEIDRLSEENKEQYNLLSQSSYSNETPDYSELIKSEIDQMKLEQSEYMSEMVDQIRTAVQDSVAMDRSVSEELNLKIAEDEESIRKLERMTLMADSLPETFELLKEINEIKQQNEEQYEMINQLLALNDSLQKDIRLYNETVADLEGVIRAVQLSLEDSLSPVNLRSDYYQVIGAFKSFEYAKMYQRGVKRDFGISSTIMSQIKDRNEYFVVYAAKTEELQNAKSKMEEYKRRILMYEIHGYKE